MKSIQYYTEKRNQLVELLLEIQRYIQNVVGNQMELDLSEAIQKLQNEKFEVIVVGEFSNGKSTFLNALLQEEVLPSASVPTTTLLNKIHYNPTPTYEVYFEDQTSYQLTNSQFQQFVSEDKRKFDGLREEESVFPDRKATHLEIGYPSAICQEGIVLIDSPGTNDMDEARVRITDEYIPKSDAAIFVLSAKKIFTDTERAFLQRIMEADIQKIFFVINFKDAIQNEEDFIEIERIVRDNLPESLKQPKVYFVSALHALQHYVPPAPPKSRRAQRRQQQRLPLEETGIVQLEEALIEFLIQEKGREKLRRPSARAQHVLHKVKHEYLSNTLKQYEHQVDHTVEQINDIHQSLNQVENQLHKESQKFQRDIEMQSKEIMRWYKNEVMQVIKQAQKVMKTLIAQGKNPEEIKTKIDLATGPMERNMKTGLQQKVTNMLKLVSINQQKQMQQDMDFLQFDSSRNEVANSNWQESIKPLEQIKETKETFKIGAAVGGIATLILSGGTIGWGMLGAAGGIAAIKAYNSYDASIVYQELEEQVNQRYNQTLLNQVESIGKQLKRIAVRMKDDYEQVVREKIEYERKKMSKWITDHELSAQEKQALMDDIRREIAKGEEYMQQISLLLKQYETIEKEDIHV